MDLTEKKMKTRGLRVTLWLEEAAAESLNRLPDGAEIVEHYIALAPFELIAARIPPESTVRRVLDVAEGDWVMVAQTIEGTRLYCVNNGGWAPWVESRPLPPPLDLKTPATDVAQIIRETFVAWAAAHPNGVAVRSTDADQVVRDTFAAWEAEMVVRKTFAAWEGGRPAAVPPAPPSPNYVADFVAALPSFIQAIVGVVVELGKEATKLRDDVASLKRLSDRVTTASTPEEIRAAVGEVPPVLRESFPCAGATPSEVANGGCDHEKTHEGPVMPLRYGSAVVGATVQRGEPVSVAVSHHEGAAIVGAVQRGPIGERSREFDYMTGPGFMTPDDVQAAKERNARADAEEEKFRRGESGKSFHRTCEDSVLPADDALVYFRDAELRMGTAPTALKIGDRREFVVLLADSFGGTRAYVREVVQENMPQGVRLTYLIPGDELPERPIVILIVESGVLPARRERARMLMNPLHELAMSFHRGKLRLDSVAPEPAAPYFTWAKPTGKDLNDQGAPSGECVVVLATSLTGRGSLPRRVSDIFTKARINFVEPFDEMPARQVDTLLLESGLSNEVCAAAAKAFRPRVTHSFRDDNGRLCLD